MSRSLVLGASLLLALAACSSPNSSGNGNDGGNNTGNPDGGTNGGADAAMPPGATRLIQSDWTIQPGTERYNCQRLTVDHDVYVTKIQPIEPVGTHHTLLSYVTNPTKPDGFEADCGTFDPSWIMIFASGVGSPNLQMPDGVALKIPAGSQIVLNLHLFNASDGVLDGTSGYDVWEVDPSQVNSIANVALAGPVPYFAVDGNPSVTKIPADGNDHTVSASCTMDQARDFFAVFPHMHQIGKHIKIWVHTAAGGDQTVYDEDYDFNNQRFASFDSIHLAQGDTINVTCTFNNDTGSPVGFGESSTDEMCFAISDVTPPYQGNSLLGNICNR